jgi:hypothetical protein
MREDVFGTFRANEALTPSSLVPQIMRSSNCCQLEHLLHKEFDQDTLFPYLEWSLDLTCYMSDLVGHFFKGIHFYSRLALPDRSHKAT